MATIRIEPALASALRMAGQGFGAAAKPDVAAVARETGGLQAQNPGAARLGIRARARGLRIEQVTQAYDLDRQVVTSWLMRGTLHMVPAEDLRWLVAFYGPVIAAKYRTRRQELGLTEEVCAEALPLIEEVLLDSGQLTKNELVARLVRNGLPIEQSGQAPVHLLVYAASHALICRGPEAGPGDPTYVLLDQWIPAARELHSAEEVVLEQARRYFGGFGPASVADFATWAGIGLGPARQAVGRLAPELLPVEVGGAPMFLRADPADPGAVAAALRRPAPAVRLIPVFDNYLFGYRDRALLLEPAHLGEIYLGGVARAAVVVDGRLVGTWTQKRTAKVGTVSVQLFERPVRDIAADLAAEAADLAGFFGLDSALTVAGP
ncbi:MAG TPA: winged helix DNA-binding domain-containing protein [Actinocrinis sp.]|nr:winged helix DNA-binding domain-containing protein [Actinocrinis sp.]